MAYGSYRRLKKVVDTFGIQVKQSDLFPNGIVPIEPSDWLKRSLEKARNVGYVNEKERSERVVYPLLSELAEDINEIKEPVTSNSKKDSKANNSEKKTAETKVQKENVKSESVKSVANLKIGKDGSVESEPIKNKQKTASLETKTKNETKNKSSGKGKT